MAPWMQIAKPLSYHSAVNCLKTIIGSAFIGHGVTVLLATTTTTTRTTTSSMNNSSTVIVAGTTTIGFGLFLALPSLMSQMVLETLLPVITATDLAYKISRENAEKVLSSASATIKKGIEGLEEEVERENIRENAEKVISSASATIKKGIEGLEEEVERGK